MATGLLEVNVRGLVVADRLLCLELLILLYQVRLVLIAKNSKKHSAAWRCKVNSVEALSIVAAFDTVLH